MQQSTHMQTYLSTNHASLATTGAYFTNTVNHVKSRSLIAHLTATSLQKEQDTMEHSQL